MLLLFLVYCFNSLVSLTHACLTMCVAPVCVCVGLSLQEVDLVREQLQRLVSLSLWRNLLPVSPLTMSQPSVIHTLP